MAQLTAPGWSPAIRARLTALIDQGAGKRLPVVFDFDNTLVCGDIGEATLAMLTREQKLTPNALPASLLPPFPLPGHPGQTAAPDPDLTAYYEALLAPTVHGPKDPTPLASGYVWAVEAMQGFSLAEVVCATRAVWDLSRAGQIQQLEVTPGQTSYPVPFFYPEMVELIAELARHEFDLWIISASNVWSVRWVVSRVLNPKVHGLGGGGGVKAEQVVGVSTLLSRSDGSLFKDAVLVREDPAYASLDPAALDRYRLTRWLQFPVPTYSGKVGVIWDLIGRKPHLAAGDSPGDLPMLAFSEHRLWIARVEKPDYQAAMEHRRAAADGDWMIQPARTKVGPGFLSGPSPA